MHSHSLIETNFSYIEFLILLYSLFVNPLHLTPMHSISDMCGFSDNWSFPWRAWHGQISLIASAVLRRIISMHMVVKPNSSYNIWDLNYYSEVPDCHRWKGTPEDYLVFQFSIGVLHGGFCPEVGFGITEVSNFHFLPIFQKNGVGHGPFFYLQQYLDCSLRHRLLFIPLMVLLCTPSRTPKMVAKCPIGGDLNSPGSTLDCSNDELPWLL